MPWKETCPMDQRMQFVIEYRSGTLSIAELCLLYGISRQTGHKWINRFSPRIGQASLEERSRRPLHSPEATPALLVQRIIARREQFPSWGARKVLSLLELQWPKVDWPHPTTVNDILKRHGLIRARKRRPRIPPRTRPFSQCKEPNDVWCLDFKGHFRTGDGDVVYPLTVMDAASRFLLACVPLRAPEGAPVRDAFEQLFRTYGLPKALRCDNGEPFIAARSPAGLSRLSAWWVKLGIRVERIDPGKPQQNGRHERMHLTLKIDTALPPKPTFRAQSLAFSRFCKIYNQVRPHEALAMKTPASLYCPSKTPFPQRTPQLQYPFADLARVDTGGSIKWGNYKYFVSSSLAGELLGIYVLDSRYAELRFATLLLGVLDTEQPLRGLIRLKPSRKT
jgi:transposase InsO family protein